MILTVTLQPEDERLTDVNLRLLIAGDYTSDTLEYLATRGVLRLKPEGQGYIFMYTEKGARRRGRVRAADAKRIREVW